MAIGELPLWLAMRRAGINRRWSPPDISEQQTVLLQAKMDFMTERAKMQRDWALENARARTALINGFIDLNEQAMSSAASVLSSEAAAAGSVASSQNQKDSAILNSGRDLRKQLEAEKAVPQRVLTDVNELVRKKEQGVAYVLNTNDVQKLADELTPLQTYQFVDELGARGIALSEVFPEMDKATGADGEPVENLYGLFEAKLEQGQREMTNINDLLVASHKRDLQAMQDSGGLIGSASRLPEYAQNAIKGISIMGIGLPPGSPFYTSGQIGPADRKALDQKRAAEPTRPDPSTIPFEQRQADIQTSFGGELTLGEDGNTLLTADGQPFANNEGVPYTYDLLAQQSATPSSSTWVAQSGMLPFPEEYSAEVDELIKEVDAQYAQLLQSQIDPFTRFQQATINSPEFQRWKSQQGFQDDNYALQVMLQEGKKKVREERRADRALYKGRGLVKTADGDPFEDLPDGVGGDDTMAVGDSSDRTTSGVSSQAEVDVSDIDLQSAVQGIEVEDAEPDPLADIKFGATTGLIETVGEMSGLRPTAMGDEFRAEALTDAPTAEAELVAKVAQGAAVDPETAEKSRRRSVSSLLKSLRNGNGGAGN